MKRCVRCGNQLKDHMRFCNACGAPQDQGRNAPEARTEPKQEKKHTGLITVLIIIVIILAAAVGYLLWRQTNERKQIEEEQPEIIEQQPEPEPVPQVTWELDEVGGVLTISGEGEMQDYDPYSDPAPWNGNKGSIRSVVVQEGVTAIGDHAFEGLYALTNVTLPQSLTHIGEKSFANCTGLYTVYIPAKVARIETAAFRGCDSLREFYVDGSNSFYCSIAGALLSKDCGTFIQLPAGAGTTEYYIPPTVTQISSGAFYNCRKLTAVTIPGGVSTLKELTFCGCSALRQITLPMSVRTIEPSAFTEKVYASDGSAKIGSTAMKKILYDGLEDWFYSMNIGADNDNLYNATLHFVDPWDMPESTVIYFETQILNR